MTTEEAKKAGFRHFDKNQYVYWQIAGEFIHQFHCYACSLREGDFSTRAKAREALRKRKMEETTKREDARIAARKAAGTHVPPPAPSETPAERDSRIKALVDSYKAKGGPITKEQLTDEVKEWLVNKNASYYGVAGAKGDRNWDSLEWLFDYYHPSTINISFGQAFWNKADAEHAKWLADMQSQTTPITAEQGKMLRPDDIKYGYDIATWSVFGIRGDAKEEPIYANPPLFFTEQAARNRLNEVIAAQAALDKALAKPCDMPDEITFNGAEYRRLADNEQHKDGDIPVDGSQTHRFGSVWYRPIKSHETPVGETQAKEVVTDEKQDKEPVKWAEQKGAGRICETGEDVSARYITPEWKAWKARQDAKAKPESSAKPTTVRGWLETIPDQAIRDAAIRQCEEWSKNCTNLPDSILNIWNWDLTSEGVEFWNRCYDAAYDGTPWPVYPSKAKQESDGWTQAEIDKAAFKSDAVSHPSHYTSHPSGVECITITKHMNFCRGNAVKYLWRAGQKGDSIDKEIEDIAKAEEYCRIEKERLIAKKGAK